MPPLGIVTGGLDFSNKFLVLKDAPSGATFATAADAARAGAITWNYGNFIPILINFFIVALCIFLVVRRSEQDEEAQCGEGSCFERLHVLSDDDSNQRDALPALYLEDGQGRPLLTRGRFDLR